MPVRIALRIGLRIMRTAPYGSTVKVVDAGSIAKKWLSWIAWALNA